MDPTASLVNCTHLHMHDHCMIMTLFLACLTNTCFHTECTLVYLDVHCTNSIWKLIIWRTLSLEGDYVVLRLFQWVLTVGKWFSFCLINQSCRCWLKLSAVNIYDVSDDNFGIVREDWQLEISHFHGCINTYCTYTTIMTSKSSFNSSVWDECRAWGEPEVVYRTYAMQWLHLMKCI